MKHFAFIILIFSGSKLFSQITSTQLSYIDCDATSTIITLYNSSGPAQYNFTLQAPSCSVNYTGTFFSTFTQFTVSCPAVYSFTFSDAANFYSFLTHTVYLSNSFSPSITATKDTICKGQNVNLSFSNVNSTYTISPFSWSNSSTVTPTTVSPTITTTYSLTGFFSSMTRTCNVQGTKTITVNDCSGIREDINSSSIVLYPNPFTQNIFINTGHSFFTHNHTFILRNAYGIEVSNCIVNKSINSIDLYYLPKGLYFAEIVRNGQSVYKTKLIKQ